MCLQFVIIDSSSSSSTADSHDFSTDTQHNLTIRANTSSQAAPDLSVFAQHNGPQMLHTPSRRSHGEGSSTQGTPSPQTVSGRTLRTRNPIQVRQAEARFDVSNKRKHTAGDKLKPDVKRTKVSVTSPLQIRATED